MDKRLIELLYNQIKEAYWNTKSHCGGDFKPQACADCSNYEFCKNDTEIEQILEKIQ